jgi:hypothetical protein
MNELQRMFPPPRLSPHFAAKTAAKVRRQNRAPRWMLLYWLAMAVFVLLSVAEAPLPAWARMVAIPIGFAIVLGWGSMARFLAPFFR